MSTAIEVEHLCKAYGRTRALDGLDLEVGTGELVAIVGPNGAGKSTAMEVLEGHRKRDSGRVSVLGFDPGLGGTRFRERIGIMLQDAGLDEAFSARELLTLYAGFYPRPRSVDDVLAQVGLTAEADTRTAALSGGQRRRADLALALVGGPDLLFLDEPTTGFDPAARQHAWEMIDGLRERGMTVVLTTHYMEEAQRLADRVGVLVRGRLVAMGTPAELAERRTGGRSVIEFRLPPATGVRDLPDFGDRVSASGPVVRVRTGEPTRDLHALTRWALDRGVALDGLALGRPSLEDVYLDLVREPEPTRE